MAAVERTLNYMSFFSGAGGLDLGLHEAGFTPTLFCENDVNAAATLRQNFPGVPIVDDVDTLTKDQVLRVSKMREDDIFLVAGGPPCQAFSTAGKRRTFADVRGNVFLKYIELCLQLRPNYILFENVRGLLSAKIKPGSENPVEDIGGSALWHVLETLEKDGYAVSFELYNSAHFGVPQQRERVILLASRDGSRVPYLVPTHCEPARANVYGLAPWRTFRDAVEEPVPLVETALQFSEFPEKRLRFYRMLQPGQNWRNLPSDVQREAMGGAFDSGGGRTGFFRRLAWDKPAPTLVTSPTMPATDLAHPERHRPLAVEEYKRVQQFPDNFIVCGNVTAQYRQLGNAVPTGLGRAAGVCIKTHAGVVGGGNSSIPEGFKFSRYTSTDDVSWRRRVGADHVAV